MKLKQIIPFIVLFTLFGLFWHELFYAKPNELPSPLIGKTIPKFQLPDLFDSKKIFSTKELIGHVSLLNIWASWCYACSLEQPILIKIKEEYSIPIYSIVYKDNPQDAQAWLQKYGNPYKMIGNDSNGDVAIDLGVYGTPETYVINPEGKILYRHIGMIDQKIWDDVLFPIVSKYKQQT